MNQIVCHLSPLKSDPEASLVLKDGDVVRVELGAHVDGYIGQVAHTLVIGASKDAPVTGPTADALQSAYLAAEAAIRLVKPGNKSYQVTEAVDKIAKEFGCNPIQGILSHQLLKNVIDGPNQIILNPSENQRKEVPEFEFEQGQVYALDIMVTTGDGKTKPQETRTTVYKRNPDANYQLKMKTSRAVFSQVQKECGTMAFSLSSLEDEKKSRLGIVECSTHGLVVPYDVLHEQEGVHVAHFIFTVLLMPSGPLKVTDFPWEQDAIKSEKALSDEPLKELLAQPYRKTKSKKKKN